MRKKNIRTNTNDEDDTTDEGIVRVEKLLRILPHDVIGAASYNCRSFTRAIFYTELHIRSVEPKSNLEVEYRRLQQMYGEIEDVDSWAAMSSLFGSLDLEQQISEHQNNGQWASALLCWDVLVDSAPDNTLYQIGELECLKVAGHDGRLVSRETKYKIFLHVMLVSILEEWPQRILVC